MREVFLEYIVGFGHDHFLRMLDLLDHSRIVEEALDKRGVGWYVQRIYFENSGGLVPRDILRLLEECPNLRVLVDIQYRHWLDWAMTTETFPANYLVRLLGDVSSSNNVRYLALPSITPSSPGDVTQTLVFPQLSTLEIRHKMASDWNEHRLVPDFDIPDGSLPKLQYLILRGNLTTRRKFGHSLTSTVTK